MNLSNLKNLLLQSDPAFWPSLRTATEIAQDFDELISLSTLRKRATARGLARTQANDESLRVAILGGCSLYPLHELVSHLLEVAGIHGELFLGEFDNYVSEIVDRGSPLYAFRPEVVILLPGPQRCRYPGAVTDNRNAAQSAAGEVVDQLVGLCKTLHERTSAEIILCNFTLPAHRDPGEFRTRTLTSDWNFRKWVNLELGLSAPRFVRVCDLEFLANRLGALVTEDARGWFESKQPCSPLLLVELSREAARLILDRRNPPKKVLVLDLDNTLWGGVVADDGLEGIEVGDTSPRGEAFKAFQKYISSLKARGVLLAVCSKNDHARAVEPFERHPEMVLRMDDFVSFKANWEPKADNLLQMAADLGLGIDSFVFADDNPAEVDIVRQFAPAVETILLDGDPATFVQRLQDCRFFEPRGITSEDIQRTGQYRAERERQAALSSAVDMDAYLASLEMEAVIGEFATVDVPRLAQLINKSNQFNLTTRRRTEAEVQALVSEPSYVCLSARLRDRFGDHGLISIIIGEVVGRALQIDTWLMSCRVLKRQVEETLLNQLCRVARSKDCERIEGVYIATAKNEMVREFYPRMGFATRVSTPAGGEFFLDLASFQPFSTRITVRASS
jgi:FkbH-like protein